VTVKIVTMTAMTMTTVVFFYMPDSTTRLRKSGLTEHLSLCNPHQLCHLVMLDDVLLVLHAGAACALAPFLKVQRQFIVVEVGVRVVVVMVMYVNVLVMSGMLYSFEHVPKLGPHGELHSCCGRRLAF